MAIDRRVSACSAPGAALAGIYLNSLLSVMAAAALGDRVWR